MSLLNSHDPNHSEACKEDIEYAKKSQKNKVCDCGEKSSNTKKEQFSLSPPKCADVGSTKAQSCKSQIISPNLSSMVTEIQRNRSSLSESHSGLEDFQMLQEPKMTKMKRSLYGVCPRPKFGPKASLHQAETYLPIQYPTDPMLHWESPPENVMVIKKIHDPNIDNPFVQLISWLVQEKKFKVFIENKIKYEKNIISDERMVEVMDKLVFFGEENALDMFVDLVICAGGDGTMIYASSLFQGAVPPIIAFHFGSLGFLLPFNFENFKEHIEATLRGQDVSLVLRSRMIALMCTCTIENCMDWSIDRMEDEDHYLVLNEVVVDRGDAAYIVQLDLFVDDMLVTVVQGDGLIISTPTGSTAYSAAAGASMVHPNVPAIVITPICPHSLSFRPIVLPSGVQIKIMLSPDARAGAWVSFDGRKRQHLKMGQMLVINTAAHPLPCVTYVDPMADWFNRLAGCLHWNVRKLQSSLQKYAVDKVGKHSIDKTTISHEDIGKNNFGFDTINEVNSKQEDKILNKTDQQNNSNDQNNNDEEALADKQISKNNLHRFNRSCVRRKKNSYKIYSIGHQHHHHHHHPRHSHHRRHLQPLRLRSSSLTDIELSFLDIKKKLSLEGDTNSDEEDHDKIKSSKLSERT